MIRANVFGGKKSPPSAFLDNLVVRGGVETIDLTLRKLINWNGTEPVCCPVLNLKEDGSINTVRWALLGSLDKNPRLLAHNLFTNADKDILITIPIDDLKIFEFQNNNASHWIESSELEIEIFDKNLKKTLSKEEAEAKGIHTFCIRTVIQPETHATALMWIGLVPMSKDNLKAKMPANYSKTSCPQIALALGAGGARARRIMLSVREKEHEGYGFGCFPLLESLQPGEISFPMIRDLRENMNRFLRGVGGTNNRSGATIMLAIENPAEAGKETPPQHTWPPLSDNSPVLGDEGRS